MALIDLYRDSVAAFAEKVAKVRLDQWNAATPCSDWDVRALVNHVVYEQRWSVPLFAGATIAEVGDRFEGDLLGDDPALSAAEAAEDAKAAVSATGALERTVHLSIGDTRAVEYVRQLLADHLVHGWDLAVATGSDQSSIPRRCTPATTGSPIGSRLYRDAGIIGPRPDLAPNASVQDELLAAFGRDPAPSR